jgi:hypothetical protein
LLAPSPRRTFLLGCSGAQLWQNQCLIESLS